MESDYNGGPWPWLQEGDLGGVSCGLGDKRQKASSVWGALRRHHWCVCVCNGGEGWHG